MKRKIGWGLCLVLFVVTMVVLFILPDKVGLHYNEYGMLDYRGSKYFCLVLPVFNLLFVWSMGRYVSKLEKVEKKINNKRTEVNTKILWNVFLIIEVFLNVICYYSLYLICRNIENLEMEKVDFRAIIATLLGFLMIVLGSMIKNTTINSALGVRTDWSMHSERTWQISNYYGGIIFIIVGILSVLFAIIIGGWISELFVFILIILATILCCVISHRVYLKEKDSESKK